AILLRETSDVLSAMDRHPQLVDPVGQYPLYVVLTQRQQVVVPAGKVADIQTDHVEADGREALPLRDKPVGDSALIENFDGTRVQAARAQPDQLLVPPARHK